MVSFEKNLNYMKAAILLMIFCLGTNLMAQQTVPDTTKKMELLPKSGLNPLIFEAMLKCVTTDFCRQMKIWNVNNVI